MNMIRSAGGGKLGRAEPFTRSIASPAAALMIVTEAAIPAEWPPCPGSAEDNLGHALGWTLEIRRDDIVIINPLGEGAIKTNLPALDDGWLQTLRHDGSCALFVATPDDDAGFALLTIDAVGARSAGAAATIRASVSADYGTPDKVGRNEPCPCGSGKKFKQCHG